MKKAYNSNKEICSNKDFTGCMGGLLHLFDFHQPHNERKLLTDKRHSDGLEAPRNSLDVSSGASQMSEIKSEDVTHVYEMKKAPSTKKKASGMPIKNLIAQEMLKETELKRRTPSVVARLMGLDAMPGESMSVQHIKATEIHPQKKTSGKQQQLPKSPREVHFFHKKLKAPNKLPQEHPLPNSYQKAIDHHDQKTSSGTRSFQEHPQEKQLQEFKKRFAAWQSSKFENTSKHRQPYERNTQLSDKKKLVHEKLNKGKVALVQEKFIDAKRLPSDEKFQRSKEFLDALEVLQSNKELFLNFLQEPNYLFANTCEDIQSNSEIPEKQLPKTKSVSPVKRREKLKEKDLSQVKNSKEEIKNEIQLQRQKGRKFLSEREVQEERTLSPDRSMSMCTSHEHHNYYSSTCSDGNNNISSMPTRIVVLKPGSGRPHNYRLSPSPSCSPSSQTGTRDSGEKERDTNQEFLREVRERLRLSFAQKKDDSITTEEGLHDQPHSVPKDPREIAKQIARQVRESVTRDLANDSSGTGDVSILSVYPSKKHLSSRSTNAFRDADAGNCPEISFSGSKNSWDYTEKSNPPVTSSLKKTSDVPKYVNTETKKTVSRRVRSTQWEEEAQQLRRQQFKQISNTLETASGRVRATQWEEEEQQLRRQQLRQISNTLGEMLAFPGNKKHMSQIKSYQQNNRGNAADNESYVLHCEMHESGRKIERSLEQKMNADRECYLGNDSVENCSTTIKRVHDQKKNKASRMNTSNEDEMGLDSQNGTIPAELIKSRVEKSIFKDKVSNLKRSIFMKGQRQNSKKSNGLHTIQPNNYVEIHLNDECDLHHEEPSNLNRHEILDDMLIPSLEKNCKPAVDCLDVDVATELCDSPACSIHVASPIDDEGYEECLIETSNLRPDSGRDKDKLADDDTDILTEENFPEDHQQNPSCCSPPQGLNVNESSSSKNNEKGGQPSPVSVLETPFQEETQSFEGFVEISSNIKELRHQLHCLKIGGPEKSCDESENVLPDDAKDLEEHYTEEVVIDNEKACTSPSQAEASLVSRFSCPEIEDINIGSMMLNGVSCPETRRADLLYVRNALVASGFAGNADAIFTKWHSPSHPMDPFLHERLQDNELTKADCVTEREANSSKQLLLFDCTNEVLLKILGTFFYPRPWVKPTKTKLQQHMPVGNQLLEETWRKLSDIYPQLGMEYTLENIVEKDIYREGGWLELQDDTEALGAEVEKLIFDDLVEQVFCDLLDG